MPQFKHCVVCFSNIYNRELPERRVRDYDNLELKRLLDVAASFMLVDDSGLWCGGRRGGLLLGGVNGGGLGGCGPDCAVGDVPPSHTNEPALEKAAGGTGSSLV